MTFFAKKRPRLRHRELAATNEYVVEG